MRPCRARPLSRLGLASLALLATTVLAACGAASAGNASSSTPTPKGPVKVAYAGSLVTLMEHQIGPAFDKATGYQFQGTSAGSTALANQIKSKLISPDVFISASAAAYTPLEGATNGNIVSWRADFAATSMVIGFSSKSALASQLQAAAQGKTPWYQVLESPGIRLGRTDPALDPKGINTLLTMSLAETYYQQPGLSQKVLGSAQGNTQQIFPEETLVARLTSGQLDAGFFYLNEVKQAGLPYITLPPQINLGDPAYASDYAKASVTIGGKTVSGAPILYSLTVPATVSTEPGAEAFVTFLLGSQGKKLLNSAGINVIAVRVSGDATAVPSGLRAILGVQ